MNKTRKKQPVKLTAEMKRTIDALGDNWIIRTDNDGKAYGGFAWGEVGVWTEAKDWNGAPSCGGGLHGQGPGGFGYWHEGTRFCFCETGDEKVIVEDNKVKVKRARILWTGEAAYVAMAYACRGKWAGSLTILCDVSLPSLKEVGGYLSIYGTAKLDALTTVGGDLSISGTAKLDAPKLKR